MALLQRETFSPKKPLAVHQPLSRAVEMSPNKGKQQLLAKYTATDFPEESISKTLSTSAVRMPPPPAPLVKPNVSLADDSDIAGSQDLIFTGK